MKVFLTGGTGQMGRAIISSKPNKINLLAPNSKQFNLDSQEDIKKMISFQKPDWIINCGAYTNVDKAESDVTKLQKINSEAPKIISQEIMKYGGKLLQISTDYVFDGLSNKPYKTNDQKNPKNAYGKSKSLAEESIKKVLKNSNQYLILRTSWIMSPYGKNFVKTILNLLQSKNIINVVDDQFGSMTSTKHLANTCWKLIASNEELSRKGEDFPNIHHWSDEGIISWYEIALAIKEISEDLGMIKNPAKIKSIKTKDYNLKAIRPKYSVLDSTETEELLNIKKVNWRISLLEIILSIKTKNNINN